MTSLRSKWEQLPEWCSVAATAKFLGCGDRIVKEMAEAGRLRPSYQTEAGKWRISKEAVAQAAHIDVEEVRDGDGVR